MRKIVFSFSLLLVPLSAIGNNFGYDNTEWGMTPSQVIAAQNGKAALTIPQKNKEFWIKVRINDVKIANEPYAVTFIFDEVDKLIQTNVISKENKSEKHTNSQFNVLNQMFTKMHGLPYSSGDEKVTWRNSSTIIELNKIIIPGIMAQIIIQYKPYNT